MRTHHFLVGLLLMACPAAGADRKPPADPVPIPAESRHAPHTIGLAANDCGLGESNRQWTVNYLEPPGDVYYTLLRTEDCSVCGPGVRVQVLDAAIVLEFQAPCAPQASVSIVGAVGDSCMLPDQATVLCGPVVVNLEGPRTGLVELRVPLPLCEFTGEAFLRVEFDELPAECQSTTERPRLLTSDRCEPCSSYNHYPGHEDDLCGLLFPGRPTMYVGTKGCGVVPVIRSTWGQLRTLYRD
jgi:hypothetical protein